MMNETYQILEWTVNPLTNTLNNPEKTVRIEPKVMSVLSFLTQHAGQIISKDQIIGTVWEEKFISDEVLTVSIHELRKALGDDAKTPRFIKTVPKTGYQFIAPVIREEPPESEDSLSVALSKPQAARPQWGWAAVGLIVLAALAMLVWQLAKRGSAPSAAAMGKFQSLAVLPLENLSNDSEQEFFADGMTDSLITDLAKIASLRVISRTSVGQYKQTQKTIPEIARELNVDAIIEGTVLRAGDQVRITVQLIDAKSDQHIWAEKYERDVRDILRLQNDVTLAIAKQINARLNTSAQTEQVAQAFDPEVYDAYLKGRFFWHQRTRQSMEKAVKSFEQALAKNPNYAPAYAGLADVYSLWGGNLLGVPDAEASEKARQLAQHALKLNPNLAEAHSALGAVKFQHDLDWAGAEESLQRAIALNPNFALAHQWYGELLSAMGRHDEAIAAMQRACALDPLEVSIQGDLAWVCYMAHRFDEALRETEKALHLDASVGWIRRMEADIYANKGSSEQALAAYKKFFIERGAGGKEFETITDLSSFYRWWLVRIKKNSPNNLPLIASLHGALGERDQAVQALEQAADLQIKMLWLNVSPDFDALRGDIRFQTLLHKIGLRS